jgi:hypothetical protein
MIDRNSADEKERLNGQPHDAGDGFAEARERREEREEKEEKSCMNMENIKGPVDRPARPETK